MTITNIKSYIVDLPYKYHGKTEGFSKMTGGKSWNKKIYQEIINLKDLLLTKPNKLQKLK